MAGDPTCRDQPCHAEACAIQDCLQRTGYNESRCTQLIDKLYACCEKFYKDNGQDARTVSCPKYYLLRLKLEQRAKDRELDAKIHPTGFK